MRGVPTRAVQPRDVGADRIEWPCRIREKRREKQHRNSDPHGKRGTHVPQIQPRGARRSTAGIYPSVPSLVKPRTNKRRGTCEHECLLRGIHKPNRRPSHQRPPQFPRTPIPPAGNDGEKREEDQQHLVYVVPAVKNHRRRKRGEQSRVHSATPSQSIDHEGEQPDHSKSEQDHQDPQPRIGQPARRRGTG